MPIINLLAPSDPNKSVDENSASLTNMYLVQNQNSGKYELSAYPSPGLSVFATISSPVRALYSEHGVLYAVGGNTFYSIASNGTPTTLGTLSTSSGFAKIRGINSELLIIDGTAGYTYNITGNSFATLSSNTYVSSIVMTASGSGYVAPTVTISDATGTGATGTATLVGGQITEVTITANGSNYTAPTISFTDAAGTGATATVYTTTSSFNSNVIDIETQDEFGIAAGYNTQEWFITSVSDLTTWPALSFASVTGNQNNLVAVTTLHREIWLLGEQTTEVWYNAGQQFFTFARRTDVYIEYGCAAKQSVALGDNTIFLLGQNRNGGPCVLRMNGYTPIIISTDAINYQLSTYTTLSDALGFVYYQEGHAFYVLTFPTQGVTWIYDVTTQTWSQRASLVSAAQTRWLPSCFSFCYNKPLVGDFNSGIIYLLDMTTYTENSAAITRTIQTHPWYESGSQTYVDRLQVDFDQTPGATLSEINLYVSRDGGHTFGSAKAAYPVQTSDGQWRCYWPRLGRARTWVFKIQTTMNNKFIVLGAWATVRAGGN